MDLLDVSGQRRLHVVGVVLDVVVLQHRLQASALLTTLLGARDLGRQAAFGEQRLFSGRQVALCDDLFDRVLNRSTLLLSVFSVLADLDV